MFDTSFHVDVVRRSHSGSLAMPPAFSRYSYGLRIKYFVGQPAIHLWIS